MAHQQMPSSQKALMLELKSLQEEPVEGFRITLVEESDLYNWEVAIFGPPNTLYEGGYFKVSLVWLLWQTDDRCGLRHRTLWNTLLYSTTGPVFAEEQVGSIQVCLCNFEVYPTSLPRVLFSLALLSPMVRSLYSRHLFMAVTDILMTTQYES